MFIFGPFSETKESSYLSLVHFQSSLQHCSRPCIIRVKGLEPHIVNKRNNWVLKISKSFLVNSKIIWKFKVEVDISVATKIENGPKINTKILQFLKMEDAKIFKGKWKNIFVKNCLTESNLIKSPSSGTSLVVGKIEVQSFKIRTYF